MATELFLSFYLGTLLWLSWEIYVAPFGYEDEFGFHLGNPKKYQFTYY